MRLRPFFRLMEAAILAEATKYDPMFAEVLRVTPPESRGDIAISKVINWARQVLAREDRIVWYLRWYRLFYMDRLIRQNEQPLDPVRQEMITNLGYSPDFVNQLRALQQKYLAQTAKVVGRPITEFDLNAIGGVRQLDGFLSHILSLPVPSIQNYQFTKETPQELKAALQTLELQWKQEQELKAQHIQPQESDQILIDFGDGWAWWLLSRGACDHEAAAMGHCGNGPSEKEGDRILSLRKQGPAGWRPSLTFILNQDGKLGEMKGRGNDKPAPQYHPYIVKLLENPIIQGIRGGGYKPENNFQMSDLPPEERERLFELNPKLASGSYLLKKYGPTDEFAAKIIDEMNEVLDGYKDVPTWDPERKIFIVEKFNTVDDLVHEYGSDLLKRVCKNLEGGESIYDYDYPVETRVAQALYDELEPELLAQIARYAKANYGGDEDYEDTDWDDSDEVWDVLDENDDGVVDAMKNAVKTGYERGAESDMYDDYVKALQAPFDRTHAGDYLEVTYTIYTDERGKEHIQMDGPCVLSLTPQGAAYVVDQADMLEEIADQGWTLGEEIKLDEPYNGWSGYDEEGAKEEATERLNWDAPDVFNY